eukprot:TRINITY_DN2655_c0_g2_i6.p1 TRINITY_DN2655_c0_g2~~TRINITY_DN2655_c0_g2_i6.p1  ORF type:complete len:188 (-),score=20.48 TRINITY_DN2655_c0_g2_i6:19-582(-)
MSSSTIDAYSELFNGIANAASTTSKNGLSNYKVQQDIKFATNKSSLKKLNKYGARTFEVTSRNSHKDISQWETYKKLTNILGVDGKGQITVIGELINSNGQHDKSAQFDSMRSSVLISKGSKRRHYAMKDVSEFTERNASTLKKLAPIKEAQLNKRKDILDSFNLSLIHICRCRRYAVCRSRWSPYH